MRYRDQEIANTAAQYDRARDLPRILGATAEDLADASIEGQRQRVIRLLRLARNSARSGRAGHWSYDPHRHVAILGALRAEQAELIARNCGECHEAATPIRPRTAIST